MKTILCLFTSLLMTWFSAKAQSPGEEYYGKASYYHRKFNGKRTSSGEEFQSHYFSAAHNTFLFGTLVEVTNVANNKSCLVRINDRGPYSRDRVIDLSQAAAEELGIVAAGMAEVKLKVLMVPQADGSVMLPYYGDAPKVEIKHFPTIRIDSTKGRIRIDTLKKND